MKAEDDIFENFNYESEFDEQFEDFNLYHLISLTHLGYDLTLANLFRQFVSVVELRLYIPYSKTS